MIDDDEPEDTPPIHLNAEQSAEFLASGDGPEPGWLTRAKESLAVAILTPCCKKPGGALCNQAIIDSKPAWSGRMSP